MRSAVILATLAIALASPAVSQTRPPEDTLLPTALAAQSCGEDRTVVTARYKSPTDDTIVVTCSGVTALVPLFAGPAIASLSTFLLVGLAAGVSNTTPDTK